MPKSTIAAFQIGSSLAGKSANLINIIRFEQTITESGAKLVVLPEVVPGGYPKGEIFGTRLGYRLPEVRQVFSR